MELNLRDKSVLITGGSAGIGKAIAFEFLNEGANVSICGTSEAKLKATQEEAKSKGFNLVVYQVDVTSKEQLEDMAEQIAQKNGGIDVWINNAGVDLHHTVLDFPVEDYDRVMKTNLYAVFEGCRIAGEHMIKQGRGGVIINASSYTVNIPHTRGSVYAASKAAVSSFTKSIAANFAPYGIRVVGYQPGMVETEMTKEMCARNRDLYIQNVPLGRLGHPEDIAKPVAFLASDACSYITGFDIQVSGGKYSVQDSRFSWENMVTF